MGYFVESNSHGALMTATDIGTLIAHSPDILHGRPRIAGTGVAVRTIVVRNKMGRSPEQIVASFGHISLAQVYAALAYYHLNRDEIEADLAQEDAETRILEEQAARSS